jgi:uncharacterized damage-inducible protein DinB
MLLETLIKFFSRDLNKLKAEVQLYKDEANLWRTSKDVTNSAGNLCLHLVGNLNAYIGAALGHTGYIRQRDLEFSLKDISRDELLNQVDEVMLTVNNTLTNLAVDDLRKEYPIDVFNEKMTTEYFLIHLSTHLVYHLGQINYHRRLLD